MGYKKELVEAMANYRMNKDKVKIELVSGCERSCICINDYRVAGSKPWGGGYVEKFWMADRKDVLKALGIKTEDINE